MQRQNERGVKATHAWKKSEFGRERDTGSLVRGNTKADITHTAAVLLMNTTADRCRSSSSSSSLVLRLMFNLCCQPAIALSLLPSCSGSVLQCSDKIFVEGSTQIQIADCRVQISVVWYTQ